MTLFAIFAALIVFVHGKGAKSPSYVLQSAAHAMQGLWIYYKTLVKNKVADG